MNTQHNQPSALLRGIATARGAIWKTCLAILLVITATGAQAALIQYRIVWSGTAPGSTARAIAVMTADLPNPAQTSGTALYASAVNALQMKVSGATSGNGVFGRADFFNMDWVTGGGATLDLTRQLVGQPTGGAAWGSLVSGGDFSLYETAGGAAAPTAAGDFLLRTNAGTGEVMRLISFVATYADARVGSTATATVGNNIYGTTLGQTLVASIPRGGGVGTRFIRIQNDGPVASAFTVKGTAGNAQFAVRYFNGAVNVTGQVVAGTFNTGALAPGASRLLRAVIAANTPLAGQTRKFLIRATSVFEPASQDTALIQARSR